MATVAETRRARAIKDGREGGRRDRKVGRPKAFDVLSDRVAMICADMLVDYELARSAVYHALWTVDRSPSDLPTASSLAKLTACNSYFRLAGNNIQVHGGIGFTWEHSAHLHLKRAKSAQLTFGDGVVQRRRLADLVPISAEAAANDEPSVERQLVR
jgi:alkylation response protein AidB-like acyl-CoA dehydrogenase